MEKWLSVSELSKITEIPESTIRRYLNKFEVYFRYDTRGKGKKYHPDTIEVLKKIAFLYSEDYQASEIDAMLVEQFPFAISQPDTITQPPIKTIEHQFEDFKTYQEQFNRQLLQELHQQREYIKNSIDKRDHDLLNAIQQMQDAKKEIAAAKEKKWWKFWR